MVRAHRAGPDGSTFGAARSRARLSQPRTQHADAVAGRAAATAAGHAGALQPVWRGLRARRALGGSSPVRYRSAAAGARPPESIGNSLFVVEHELDVIRHADWIVDVGPGAGELGGHVLYSGPPEGLKRIEPSLTRRHLFREVCSISRDAARADGMAAPARRHPQQPCRTRRRFPAGRADQRDRRFRLGQVEPGQSVSGRSGG